MMDMSEDDEISEISDRSIIGLHLLKLWLDDGVRIVRASTTEWTALAAGQVVGDNMR